MMNKKLKKLIEDEEATLAKIDELQEHLKDVRRARKDEENLEIVRSFRTMKLAPREMLSLLDGIQKGNVSIESTLDADSDGLLYDDSSEDSTKKRKGRDNTGAEDAPESEENHE